MSYPPGVLGPYMELYSSVVHDFTTYLSNLTPSQRTAAADFDGQTISVQSVLNHVINAGCYYTEDLKHALRGTTPATEPKFDLPADPLDAIRSLIPRTAEVLEGFWERTEAELAKMTVLTSWNQTFSVDQMFEHAIVHILWHKRQCQRIIARAKLD